MRGPYPGELRRRVIGFVEAGGSRREAAEQFDVGVSSAIRWMQRFCEDGTCEPMPRGGSTSPLEEYAQQILAGDGRKASRSRCSRALRDALASSQLAKVAQILRGDAPLPRPRTRRSRGSACWLTAHVLLVEQVDRLSRLTEVD
jgi:transposase